jgi:hypothetical protein
MAHLSEPKVVFNSTNAFQEGPRTIDKQKIHGEGQIWNDGVDITQFVSSTKLTMQVLDTQVNHQADVFILYLSPW